MDGILPSTKCVLCVPSLKILSLFFILFKLLINQILLYTPHWVLISHNLSYFFQNCNFFLSQIFFKFFEFSELLFGNHRIQNVFFVNLPSNDDIGQRDGYLLALLCFFYSLLLKLDAFYIC